MKMAAAFIEAFGIGIGIGVVIAIGSRLFRIRIANPDIDSDSDAECYGLSLFSEQSVISLVYYFPSAMPFV
jgi:hypothetical protein